MKSDLVDVTVLWRLETEKAICAALDGEHEDVWLPKSQVEWVFADRTPLGNRIAVVTLRENLAIEKGLV